MLGYDYYSGHSEERIREERHREQSTCEDNAASWREPADRGARETKDEISGDARSGRDHIFSITAPLGLPTSFFPDYASMTGQNGNHSSYGQAMTDAEPRDGQRTEVVKRWQELLSKIAWQYSRPVMSADEQEYLDKLSSMVKTLNLESIASIDVLKLCIVCSRFYPCIDIHGDLDLLKSGIASFLGVKRTTRIS
jgi:hypothetical protein